LGWVLIDQGEGVPIDPAKSLRTDFREVVIKMNSAALMSVECRTRAKRSRHAEKKIGSLKRLIG